MDQAKASSQHIAMLQHFQGGSHSKYPEKTQDMLGYLVLVIEARMEYEGDGWLGYDRQFRQNAAASPDATWARIDPTLWNMAFICQAKISSLHTH